MQGHIHKRVHSTNDGRTTTTYYVVVDRGRDSNGRRRQKWHGGFRTRREAEAAQAKIVNDLNGGAYVSPTTLTFEGWVRDTWLPAVKSQLKASKWDSYRRNLELHVLPRIGHRQLQQLTAPMLNALYAELLAAGRRNGAGGLGAKTVRYIHTTIHKALSDAVDADLVPRNVAAKAKPPRPQRVAAVEMRFWSAPELAQFLSGVAGTRLEAAWRLAAMTGMRRGEVLGLRWRDVDLDSARLSVRRALVSVAYAIVESTPKTHQARVIDLDPGTVGLLRVHSERQRAEKSEWGRKYRERDLVFCQENGGPMHPDGFTQRLHLEVRRSGLPRIRLHDLRHTHASIALQAGIPVKVISERLGHESPAFTLKQYAHVLPGMQAEGACRIAAVVSGATQSAKVDGEGDR